MRKLLSLVAFFAVSIVGQAQDVDNFEVGPYEVEYKGSGDYKFRLRKDVNLYEYYGLKKDTLIQNKEEASKSVMGAFQLNVSMSLPRYVTNGASNVFGIDGSWKQKIGNKLYFNAGLSLAMSFGKYGEAWKSLYADEWKGKDGTFTESLFEVGVPLSIELGSLDYKKSSLYGSVGVVPTFYTGVKSRSVVGNDGEKIEDGKSGFFVAPRLDVGGYFPIGNQLVRLGGFVQYNVNCSGDDFDVFKERIGRLFVGANIGLVL